MRQHLDALRVHARETAVPFVVPEGQIFMMGDNRFNSQDSRYWGPLDVDLIRGKALFIYWSWDKERNLPRVNRMGDLIR
ncbi:signal peptidase I [bacterium]|nr:signal peptidase I [bacterium]